MMATVARTAESAEDGVFILLATFNGAAFLPALLASLVGQRLGAWTLLVRDDGSDDSSREILGQAAARDARIELISDDGRHLGCAANFGRLAALALARGARHIAFCDQDDVWFPHKLETQLGRLRALEVVASERPALVYSNLALVDGEGQAVPGDYFRRAGVEPMARRDLGWLLTHNVVPGCSMMFNRALATVALPIPDAAVMHDWWFALCASITGVVEGDQRSLLAYRVHRNNAVGNRSPLQRFLGLWSKLGVAGLRARYTVVLAQLAELKLRCGRTARGPQADLLDAFLRAQARAEPWSRCRPLASPARRLGLQRNLELMLQMITRS